MRIQKGRRRHGLGNETVGGGQSTHVIKIGWKGEKDLPQKLSGFLVCRDDINTDKRFLIDYPAMAKLGFSQEKIGEAIKRHFSAPDGSLPKSLHFVIMGDAAKDGEDWTYPGIYSEGYECYNKQGKFCWGDGRNATRKEPDQSTKQIACVPVRAAGAAAEACCPFSVKRECRLHFRLCVCLLVRDPATGKLSPLSPELGQSARYRLDSTSEHGGIGILEVLDSAANRVGGNINGLTGTLTYQAKRRRTGDGQAIVGHIGFNLDEGAILARQMDLSARASDRMQRAIEAKREGVPLLEFVPQPGTVIDVEGELVETPAQNAAPAPAASTSAQPITSAKISIESEDDGDGQEYGDPEPSPIDNADPLELADSLQAYADSAAKDRGMTARTFLRDLAVEVEPRVAKHVQSIIDSAWFLDGATEQSKAVRVELLRQICRKLDDEEAPGFVIKPREKSEAIGEVVAP